jgi:hypothetical protein
MGEGERRGREEGRERENKREEGGRKGRAAGLVFIGMRIDDCRQVGNWTA